MFSNNVSQPSDQVSNFMILNNPLMSNQEVKDMEPVWNNNIGSQKPLLPTKRKASTEPLSPMSRTTKTTQRVRPAGQEVSPKSRPAGQTGSIEPVRSKMRETLASALSVGSQNEEKASNNDDSNNNNSSSAPTVDNNDNNAEAPRGGPVELTPGETGGQEPQYNYVMPDSDGSFGDTFFVKDELLQGNGLSWAWDMEVPELKQAQIDEKSNSNKLQDTDIVNKESPQELASKIESELFKLFGGVNKKYKEKGRSLMFNLKDRNNPELREKVLSGEISPERLCSMTPEELASKQLSEWRMAKAEELDKMIVLPDSDVDIRKLVKKTHKGEYQVEVEHDDDPVSVEVSSSSSFSQFRVTKKTEIKEKEKEKEMENITIPSDGTDFMQELIVDEFKDEGFLPPIVSLDEFMESLDSEPPFENLPVDSVQAKPLSEPDGSDVVRSEPVRSEPDRTEQVKAKSSEALSSVRSSVERKVMPASSVVIGAHVWEGELQLAISSSVSVIGLFRSGEKTSTKEWPDSMEIKGRVRLDAFEKFLQELPMSRTRAVMVVHFVLKDSSSEIHRAMLSEAVDSYISDERLGFGEPNPGIELYFCPPHTKIIQMLSKHLSKNQNDILKPTDNGLIGVVVWRRPHINFTNPPSSSQHKHHKPHNFQRRDNNNNNNINTNNNNSNFPPKLTPAGKPSKFNNDDEDDDIPPGFGPGVAAAARDEDDLPEFNFGQKMAARVTTSRPVDQMRQLILKYGQTTSGKVDDDDDDMPEWRPENYHRQEVAPVHSIQPPSRPPHMVGQIRPPVGQVMRPMVNQIEPQVNVVRWPPPPVGPHVLPPNAAVPGQYHDGPWRLDAPRSRGF